MILACGLFIGGILLSAFFSGSETGFYRVNRVRLMLDALGGDLIARSLLALTNHASIFVATVLVGNNLANYITSLAMVIGVQRMFDTDGSQSHLPEMLAPILLAPILFVYGELMPKNLFYDAPNRLLRKCGIPLLVFTVLFFPLTCILWALSRALQWLAGESIEGVRLGLARKELQQVFDEGHEAGILRAAQRGLAQGLFAVANRPIHEFVIPPSRIVYVRRDMEKREMRRLARRHRQANLPVEEIGPGRKLVGYIRAVDLYLDDSAQLPPVRLLVTVPASDNHIVALTRLEEASESLGHVVDDAGRTVGFLTTRSLSEPLFRGQ